MGRLGCNCGVVMSNVDCPSANIIHVYSNTDIQNAISVNPQMTLWDFRSLRRENEYWYCTSCHRVHKVNVANGHCIQRYHLSVQPNNISSLIEVPHDWDELFVITDIEIDRATEQDFSILLRAYLATNKRRVMVSPDQQTIGVFDVSSAALIAAYEPEKIIPVK